VGQPIIAATGLGKSYRLIGAQAPYYTLRESLACRVAGLWQRLKGGGSAGGNSGAAQNFWALKDVSFAIQPGEVVGIIGRNGAGKSTLLKILSGITEPAEGRVEMYGRVGSLLEVGTGFHLELTGRENIYLSGAILGMRRAEIARKFDEITAFSGVEKFLDMPCKYYSSGMLVRLGFAVAAHLEPEILIIDEVLAVGDAEFQKKCMGKMGEVSRGGRTVLFVSHNLSAVRDLCSRVILINGGKIVADGPSQGVLAKYLSESTTVDKAAWRTLHSTGLAKIDKVFTSASDTCPAMMIDYDSPFKVAIEFFAEEPLRNAHVAVKIKNSLEVTVAMSRSCDFPAMADGLHFERGPQRVVLHVPATTLAPGRYYCSDAAVFSLTTGHYHNITGNLWPFEIVGGKLEWVADEVIRPRWKWTKE
jgi:lipopolysaccharide transport system ATP-binding protein